jgi:hypothetical protein
MNFWRRLLLGRVTPPHEIVLTPEEQTKLFLEQNLKFYMRERIHYVSDQAKALQNFDAIFEQMKAACQTSPWSSFIAEFRDPIANDPEVKPDRKRFLTCQFCGAKGLKPVLTGQMQLLTLPTHPDSTYPNLACIKSGSTSAYDFEVESISAE